MSGRWLVHVCVALSLALFVGGCRAKQKAKPQPSAPAAPGGGLTPAPADPVAATVDALDSPDPQVRGVFPATNDVQGWVKISPVEKFDSGKLDNMGPGYVAWCQPYNVDWAARAQYRFAASQDVVVQLFHCTNSADAFGLMSVASGELQPDNLGEETRRGPNQLHIWKGPFYVHLYSPTAIDSWTLSQLAKRVQLPASPAGAVPELVRSLPSLDLMPGRLHYFKGPVSLSSKGLELPNQQSLAAAIDIDPAEEAVVAGYAAPGADSPCYMFVVRYATPQRALSAYDRLAGLIEKGDSRLGLSMLVADPPPGNVVWGTLTSKEYSLLESAATPENADKLPLLQTLGKIFGR